MPHPTSRPRINRVDVVLPLAIALLGTVEILGVQAPGSASGIAIEWAACGLLVFRRFWPMTVGTIAGIGPNLMPFVGPELNELSAPILIAGLAVFTLGRHVVDLRGLVSLAALVLTLMGVIATTRELADVTDIVFALVLLTPCYVFGRVMRLLADRNRILAAHAALLEERQAAAQREAVAAERARMARELHDVLAHSISVMTVQAAAAQDLVRVDTDAAIVALGEVQSAGRGALTETSRMLKLLRDHDDELGLAPEPSIADVFALVAEFRRGGLEVRLQVTGELIGLPASVAVSAYRLTREILTNALKHSADRSVALCLGRTGDGLDIAAENACAPDASTTGGGFGLIGLAERVSAHGGTLAYGQAGEVFRLGLSLPAPTELVSA